ncbi:MAG: 1-acyl-sn-glycerol-3-phosphate acyltransferase [Endomicrobia bacterium]|nr:1-acyl-sn-glycerol-3-phosphate acyltransferase [Endomicrobiia bacterium]MCL2799279.1 1-acyl-sn-glycerol-3-phosphate acyltransferase [Endomicrobiia bacterium]
MPDFIKKLYGAPFAAAAWTWLFISGIFAVPYFYFTGYKENALRNFLYFQGKVVQFAVFFASGFSKKVVKGKMPDKASILVANHPCTYDTFVFFDFGIKNLVCIAKGWPFKIIFYGKFIEKAGYINSEGKTAEEIIEDARVKIERGLNVAVFPEGTRSKVTGRFRTLAFEAAIRINCPVVPFVIKGLAEMLPPGSYCPKYNPVEYIQLETVYPDKFQGELGAHNMAKHVKNMVVQKLEER